MNLLVAMKVFDRTCALGSLSAAARDLNMSTTAVSRLIKELEDDLGVRLINRTTRRLGLTEAGREYSERTRVLLNEIAELQDSTRGLHSATRGLLRISCSNVLAQTRITRLLPRFLEENPQASVEFNLTSRYVVGIVEEGYDVAIRFEAQTDSALIARQLGQVRNYVCATPGYLDRHGRPGHPHDLAAHSCVLSNFARRIGTWPFVGEAGPFNAAVGGRVSTNSVEAAYQMTLAGFGIGNLPSLLVDKAIAAGELEVLLDDFRPGSSPIYAVYPHRTYVAGKVRAFVEFLSRELSPDLV
ncbi:LysR family transcriptional regulator [Mesorhizobium sp. LHD-90]|uniref:LysR family transcriptional regulator n=1 Tax=Mesorhizobium sp. LHD-90 TaxID=3071414 RepID=UPI0027E17DAF|nr:LysR family transcriptional regulator [Mesorhizobium sp. LHD-90]MDQ6436131.1 LysR family transcriptional regulator [Mesorhizobium sp. LHD-90]